MLFLILSFLIMSSSLSLGSLSRSAPANRYNSSIPAVICFGDSIVDTGNNNNLVTIFKVNYPPYGQDFMGGLPTGRFSNGKVPSDLIAEELGIKGALPAYLDPNLQTEDLITGVNFASGGNGFDPLTSELASVISLSDQLELFKEYLTKLTKTVGEKHKNQILSEGLYAVVTGSNDIANTYFGIADQKSHYDIPSYTDLMLISASSFVQDLRKMGARKIAVFGLPPIGCVPAQRTFRGGVLRECADDYNEMSQLFNSKLIAEINSLNKNYPKARIIYADIYNLPLDLINNPKKYGFAVSHKGCCGTGAVEVALLCQYTCSDVSDYVFWDSFHLTEKAYRLIVQQFLKQNLNSFI